MVKEAYGYQGMHQWNKLFKHGSNPADMKALKNCAHMSELSKEEIEKYERRLRSAFAAAGCQGEKYAIRPGSTELVEPVVEGSITGWGCKKVIDQF